MKKYAGVNLRVVLLFYSVVCSNFMNTAVVKTEQGKPNLLTKTREREREGGGGGRE